VYLGRRDAAQYAAPNRRNSRSKTTGGYRQKSGTVSGQRNRCLLYKGWDLTVEERERFRSAALRHWGELGIWPNGVAADREKASAFVASNGHFRLSIADRMLLHGFPSDWPIKAPIYKALALIGNSVARLWHITLRWQRHVRLGLVSRKPFPH
jgi:hypothetical protein